ncbi:ICAL protein, partial [Polypterus senegalus]
MKVFHVFTLLKAKQASTKSAAGTEKAAPPAGDTSKAKQDPTKPAGTAKAKKHEADSALDALAGSLAPQDVPAPKTPKFTGPEVNEGQVPPKLTSKKPEVPKDTGMSLAALDALGKSLGVPDTKPEPPQPLPKDIVTDKLTATHVDKLGERDDTLPPGYRFPADKDKKTDLAKPAEGPKPSIDSALDTLSGSLLPAGPTPTAKPEPAVDKVKEKATSKHSDKLGEREDTIPPEYRFEDKDKKGPTPAPQQPKISAGTDSALDALSGTLMPDIPAPEPKPVPPSAVVKENIKEKHVPKLGDNDNTIPPEYRMKLEKGSEAGSKEEVKPKDPKQIAKEQNSAIDTLLEGFDSQPPEKVEDKKDAAGSASNSALSTKSPEKDPKATKFLYPYSHFSCYWNGDIRERAVGFFRFKLHYPNRGLLPT